MPHVQHCFLVTFDPLTRLRGPYTGGIRCSSPDEVEGLSAFSGFPIVSAGEVRNMEVLLPEGDPKLEALYAEIERRLGFTPATSAVVPVKERALRFGVKRRVTWQTAELDACEFLHLNTSRFIADHVPGDEGQMAREEYVVHAGNHGKTAVQLGLIVPFNGIAVAEPLRSRLLESGLAGLHLPPVTFASSKPVRKALWALRSHVILPPALNPLLNEAGEAIEPNTEWWCWWDDGGRRPVTLRYSETAIRSLQPFDIALTGELVGHHRPGACRCCIVSQHFRATLTRLKVQGASYVPVELVAE